MNTQNRSRVDMLIRVRNFGADHDHLFPENSTAHQAFATLTTEVAQIETLAVAEQVAFKSVRSARSAAARQQLLDKLVRAANTARVLSRTIPELAPHGELSVVMGDRRLLTFARAFAAAVAPHAAQFAASGLAIDGLGGLIEAMEAAVNEREKRRDELAQTRGRLDESLKRALAAVETLDMTVGNTLVNDPVTLAAWKRERRPRWRRPRAAAVARPAVQPAVPAESVLPEASRIADDAKKVA
jgi:hypothetical protein